MKHLKTFEDKSYPNTLNKKYKKGDLVLFNDFIFDDPYYNDPIFDNIDVKNRLYKIISIDDITGYTIKGIYKNADNDICYEDEKNIRLATSDEIKKYELEQNIKKYNI